MVNVDVNRVEHRVVRGRGKKKVLLCMMHLLYHTHRFVSTKHCNQTVYTMEAPLPLPKITKILKTAPIDTSQALGMLSGFLKASSETSNSTERYDLGRITQTLATTPAQKEMVKGLIADDDGTVMDGIPSMVSASNNADGSDAEVKDINSIKTPPTKGEGTKSSPRSSRSKQEELNGANGTSSDDTSKDKIQQRPRSAPVKAEEEEDISDQSSDSKPFNSNTTTKMEEKAKRKALKVAKREAKAKRKAEKAAKKEAKKAKKARKKVKAE